MIVLNCNPDWNWTTFRKAPFESLFVHVDKTMNEGVSYLDF